MLIAQREIALLYEDDIVRQQLDHIILIQEVCKSRGIKVCQNNALVDVTKDIDMDNADDHIISRHLSVIRKWLNIKLLPHLLIIMIKQWQKKRQ